MQPFLARQTTYGAVIASFSSITMRTPGTSATPKGTVTRSSFVSFPAGSISRAITNFWPDARWPSEAVKQTSLVPISDDCSVRPLAQYLLQGEEISCICRCSFCNGSSGATRAGGACGRVEGCWANAFGPTVRASATIGGPINRRITKIQISALEGAKQACASLRTPAVVCSFEIDRTVTIAVSAC